MPHALTERQKEYLEFIREYIRENEMSPGLDEIARHFSVKPPTAHKILEALQTKGFVYFIRSSEAGFFKVVRAGFCAARKQIGNSLAQGLDIPKAEVLSLLQKAGLPPQRRAEDLSLEDWAKLERIIFEENRLT